MIGNKLDLARQLAVLMPEKDAAPYFAMLRSDKPFFYLRRRAAPDAGRRRSTRSASRAWRSTASPTGSTRRPALPRMSSAIPTSTATASPGSSAPSTSDCATRATRGEPLTLSISSRVQQALEHELNAAMTTFSAIGAAGVIMDIHTGEVLAMTSLPQLNPNVAGQGSPEARFNRATLGVYELGSTFKPFTVAMAMDSRRHQVVRPDVQLPRRAAASAVVDHTTPTRSAAPARSPRS